MLTKEARISADDLGHVKENRRARLMAGQTPDEDNKIDLTLDMLNFLKPYKLAAMVQPSPLDTEEAEAIVMDARKAAGWVTEEDLAALAAEAEADEAAEGEPAPAA